MMMRRVLVSGLLSSILVLGPGCGDGVSSKKSPVADASDRTDAPLSGDAWDRDAQGTSDAALADRSTSDAGAAPGAASDGDALATDGGASSCGPDSLAGIALGTAAGGGQFDPLGYAPYAIYGCALAYLSAPRAGEVSGELRLRNLALGSENVLAPASDQPGRPAIAGSLIAWEAVATGKTIVRVSNAGQVTTVAGPFDHAGEPHVATDAVVFTAWLTPDDAGDTDVYLYLPGSGQLVAIATGPGQQRFADVSASFVAITDFSEDPTGTFNPTVHRNADIVVYDRKTLIATVRHLPGKQAFPMLGSASGVSYLDWGAVNPEPKFSAYAVRVGNISSDPTTDRNVKGAGQVTVSTPYVRPSVRGDWVEWVDESAGGGLFRRPIDLSLAATSTLHGYQLFGPMAGTPLSVVASAGSRGFVLHPVAW